MYIYISVCMYMYIVCPYLQSAVPSVSLSVSLHSPILLHCCTSLDSSPLCYNNPSDIAASLNFSCAPLNKVNGALCQRPLIPVASRQSKGAPLICLVCSDL